MQDLNQSYIWFYVINKYTMNLKELHSFSMADAVKFHNELNPKLFAGQHLDPIVRRKLLVIARDFITELGISDLNISDITVSGSNAAYSYTPHSDLDLHILTDMNEYNNNEVYKELFDAKKNVYNDKHDVKIKNIPVELYVQDKDQPHHSLGEYSVLRDEWIKRPTKRRANFDQSATRAKYSKLKDLAERGIKSGSLPKVVKAIDKIKQYRKSGLANYGEFGPENLAYKMIRNQGILQQLFDKRDELHSKKLSYENMYQNINESKVTLNQIYKDNKPDDNELIWDYGTMLWDKPFEVQQIDWHSLDNMLCSQYNSSSVEELFYRLGQKQKNVVRQLVKDPNLSNETIVVDDGYIVDGNHRALAAVFSKRPIKYVDIGEEELSEGASGYIPTKAQSSDPRYKTALTVDVKPDTLKKNLKAFGFGKTSRAGIPPQARPDGKV